MTDTEATKLWACIEFLWPGEGRLPEGWQRRWREHFDGYPVETVCEALRSISDKSDPIRPTFDMVDEWLGRWSIVTPGSREVAIPATPEQEAEMRAKALGPTPDDAEVDELCEWLYAKDPAKFDAIASEKLRNQPTEVRMLISKKKPINSRILRREVAAHARAHGLIKGGLFQEAR